MINLLLRVAFIVACAVILLSVLQNISIKESIAIYRSAVQELWQHILSLFK